MNRAGWKAILRTLWQTSMVGAWTLVTAKAATVRIDTSRAPALKAWADSTEAIAREWYPRLGNLLATTQDHPLPNVAIRVNPDFKGIAAASWSSIEISANWIIQHPEDSRGAVIHELVHVIQAHPPNKVGWLTVSVTRSTTTAGCVDQGKLAAWTRVRVYPC